MNAKEELEWLLEDHPERDIGMREAVRRIVRLLVGRIDYEERSAHDRIDAVRDSMYLAVSKLQKQASNGVCDSLFYPLADRVAKLEPRTEDLAAAHRRLANYVYGGPNSEDPCGQRPGILERIVTLEQQASNGGGFGGSEIVWGGSIGGSNTCGASSNDTPSVELRIAALEDKLASLHHGTAVAIMEADKQLNDIREEQEADSAFTDKELVGLETRIRSLETQTDHLREYESAHTQRIEGLEYRTGELEANLETVGTAVFDTVVPDLIRNLQDRTAALEAATREFKGLAVRVKTLEAADAVRRGVKYQCTSDLAAAARNAQATIRTGEPPYNGGHDQSGFGY